MNPEEIWQDAVQYGEAATVSTKGKTPWATLGARVYIDIKENRKSIFTKPKKSHFGLKAWDVSSASPPINESVPQTIVASAQTSISNSKKVPFLEKQLHPFLAYYAHHVLRAHAKTINHSTSAKGEFGEWVHPDMVSCSFPFSVNEWRPEVLEFSNAVGNTSVKLCAFELKRELSLTNLREAFFQAVSNSSWANESYLVVAELSDDSAFRNELKRLSSSFNIGLIRLDLTDPDASETILPARYKASLDWDTINKLAMNKDFKEFLFRVQKDLKSGEVYKEQYDRLLTKADLLKSIS